MPIRKLDNGATDYYEEKSQIFAILRSNYDDYAVHQFGLEGKIYPPDHPAKDWSQWTFLRIQEIHSRDRVHTSHSYTNPSPASQDRILRCIVALYSGEWNPRVNTHINVNLSFNHYWVRGKG